MVAKYFLVFATVLACVEFLAASPTRRLSITEATASDQQPTTNEWDDTDNDEFDLDGQSWYSQPVVSPSAIPKKLLDYNDYDDDYSNRVNDNAMVDFGSDDSDDDDDNNEDQQDAEENIENNANDSEFLFAPPKDTRLVLEDDDDDQSGPIKVRHTGRSSYPKVSEGVENSIESVEDDKEDREHPYEFAIDEDDKDEDDEDGDDEDPHKDEDVEAMPRREVHEDNDDEDEFVSDAEDSDMFDNPEEEAAQVIYGDHVFLY